MQKSIATVGGIVQPTQQVASTKTAVDIDAIQRLNAEQWASQEVEPLRPQVRPGAEASLPAALMEAAHPKPRLKLQPVLPPPANTPPLPGAPDPGVAGVTAPPHPAARALAQQGIAHPDRPGVAGLPGDLLAATVKGVGQAGQMVGAMAHRAFPDSPTGGELNTAVDQAFPYSQQVETNPYRRALTGGVESFVGSVVQGMPFGAIGVAGGAGLKGALTAGALGPNPFMSYSQYEQTLEEMRNAGVPADEAAKRALISAVAEGGFETLSDLITVNALLKPPAPGLLGGLKQYGRAALATALSETPTEVLTTAVQEGQRKAVGLQGPSVNQAMKETALSTAMAAPLFALLGAGGHVAERSSTKQTGVAGAMDEARQYQRIADALRKARQKSETYVVTPGPLLKRIANLQGKVEASHRRLLARQGEAFDELGLPQEMPATPRAEASQAPTEATAMPAVAPVGAPNVPVPGSEPTAQKPAPARPAKRAVRFPEPGGPAGELVPQAATAPAEPRTRQEGIHAIARAAVEEVRRAGSLEVKGVGTVGDPHDIIPVQGGIEAWNGHAWQKLDYDDEIDALAERAGSQFRVAGLPETLEEGQDGGAGQSVPTPTTPATATALPDTAPNEQPPSGGETPGSGQEPARGELDHGKLAEVLADDFLNGVKHNKLSLRKRVAELTGKKPTEVGMDERSMKGLEETVEEAVVRAARAIASSGLAPEEKWQRVKALYDLQPRLDTRTSDRIGAGGGLEQGSISRQAYSTPIPLAYALNEWVTQGNPRAKTFEGTAGHGALVVGTDLGFVAANELDKRRAESLTRQGFTVYNEDALGLLGRHPELQGWFEAVIMNPPFGERQGHENIDHEIALQHLEAMRDSGRAIIVMGGHYTDKMRARKDPDPASRTFLRQVNRRYNLTHVIEVERKDMGGIYGKQGAAYPISVLVIEGRREKADQSRVYPRPSEVEYARSADEIRDILQKGEARELGRAGLRRGQRGAEVGEGGSEPGGAGDVPGEQPVADRPTPAPEGSATGDTVATPGGGESGPGGAGGPGAGDRERVSAGERPGGSAEDGPGEPTGDGGQVPLTERQKRIREILEKRKAEAAKEGQAPAPETEPPGGEAASAAQQAPEAVAEPVPTPKPAAEADKTKSGKSVRFQRADLSSAIRSAKALQADTPRYIYATANGYVIDKTPPPFGQQHIVIEPDGTERVVSSAASLAEENAQRDTQQPFQAGARVTYEVNGEQRTGTVTRIRGLGREILDDNGETVIKTPAKLQDAPTTPAPAPEAASETGTAPPQTPEPTPAEEKPKAPRERKPKAETSERTPRTPSPKSETPAPTPSPAPTSETDTPTKKGVDPRNVGKSMSAETRAKLDALKRELRGEQASGEEGGRPFRSRKRRERSREQATRDWENLYLATDGEGKPAGSLDAKVMRMALDAAHAMFQDGLDDRRFFGRGLLEILGETVRPYLVSIHNAMGLWPEGQAFDSELMDLVTQEATDAFREGTSDQQELGESLANTLGEEVLPFAPAVHAAVSAWPGLQQAGEDGLQTMYLARSMGPVTLSLIPIRMATATEKALDDLQEEVGDLDEWVAGHLGFESSEALWSTPSGDGRFNAGQIDSLALAIAANRRKAGMVIGHQTGQGKGRIAAGMLRWALLQGKKPIFVTKDPTLFSDMLRDWQDITDESDALRSPRIWVFNTKDPTATIRLPAEGGEVTGKAYPHAQYGGVSGAQQPEHDILFATYTQFNTALVNEKGEKVGASTVDRMLKWEQRKKDGKGLTLRDLIMRLTPATPKQRALVQAARGNYLVLDESHASAGESNTGFLFQQATDKAAGVTYLSATYAKSPEAMAVYSKTALGKFVGIKDALKRGGLAMQQVVARMLSEAGEMARLEMDASEIHRFDTMIDEKRAEGHVPLIDSATAIMREMVKMDTLNARAVRAIDDPDVSKRTVEDAVLQPTSVNFSGVAHYLVQQALLSLKLDATVEEAIRAHKGQDRLDPEFSGPRRKPVIVLSFTNMAAIQSLVDSGAIKKDEWVPVRGFAQLLERTLLSSMAFRVVNAEKSTAQNEVRDTWKWKEGTDTFFNTRVPSETAELHGEEWAEWKASYYATLDQIRKTDLTQMPLSPIDHMIERLGRAGIRVGEITGRNLVVETDGNRMRVVDRKEAGRKRKQVRDAFNAGDLDALVLNSAGATGISLHASSKFKDRAPRHMIVAQPPPNINDTMQAFGRINRLGQVERPWYTMVHTALPAELRLATILQRKMAGLNANTSGARKSAVSLRDIPDMMNDLGDKVNVSWLLDNEEFAVALLGQQGKFDRLVGRPKIDSEGKLHEREPAEDGYRSWTGKLALAPVAEQERYYREMEEEFGARLAILDEQGENPFLAKNYDLQAQVLERKTLLQGPDTGSPLEQGVFLQTLSVLARQRPYNHTKVEALSAEARKAEHTDREVQRRFDAWNAVLEQRLKDAGAYDEEAQKHNDELREKLAVRKAAGIKERPQAATRGESEEEGGGYLILKTPLVQRAIAQLAESRTAVEKAAEKYAIGQGYVVSRENAADQTVVFLGLSWPAHSSKRNSLRPELIRARFAVPTSKQQAWFTLAELEKMQIRRLSEDGIPSQWDALAPKGDREIRAAYTGNILQALSKADDGHNTVPHYREQEVATITYEDGSVADVVLLPDYFSPRDLKRTRLLKPDEVLVRLQRGGTMESDQRTKAGDPHVRLKMAANRYQVDVSVPGAATLGGRYFNDEELLRLTNEGEFQTGKDGFRHATISYTLPETLKRLEELGAWFSVEEDIDFGKERAEDGDEDGGHYAAEEEGGGEHSEAFWRWFGDSKVVDEDGEPLVVYHGTGEQFNIFGGSAEDRERFRAERAELSRYLPNLPEEPEDFHYFSDEWTASTYGPNLVPVYLSIRNPLDLTDLSNAKAAMKAAASVDVDTKQDVTAEVMVHQAAIKRWAEEHGYDGIKQPESSSGRSYPHTVSWVAFRPEQIKSATGNRGTFDSNAPSIFASSDEEEQADGLQAATPSTPRIVPAPLPGGKLKSPGKIIADFSRMAGHAVRNLNPGRRRAKGSYRPADALTRILRAGDIPTAMHEIGHWLDDFYALHTDGSFDADLRGGVWGHGSRPPAALGAAGRRKYRRAERVAEFVRAWLLNPSAARAAAPRFAAHFEQAVPRRLLQILRKFGNEARQFSGLSAGDKVLSNIARVDVTGKGERESVIGKILESVRGGNEAFRVNLGDHLVAAWVDDLHAAVKGFHAAREMRGVARGDVLPSEDFEKMARIYGHVRGKILDILEHGMVSGNDESKRATPGGISWLLEPTAGASRQEWQQAYDDAVTVLLAERTYEFALKATAAGATKAQIRDMGGYEGGMPGESGVGIAGQALFELQQDWPRYQRAREVAARYRKWADSVLRYQVQKGRLSNEDYQHIRQANEYYAAMHVLDDALETGPALRTGVATGGRLGSVKDWIKTFHASRREKEDPLVNLLVQTERLVREADRNEAMQALREMLTAQRGMHDPDPEDLQAIGFLAPEGTEGAIPIYVGGEKELWKFHKGIIVALKAFDLAPDLGSVGRMMRFAAQVMHKGVTYTPQFAVRNLIRDIEHRSVVSRRSGVGYSLPVLRWPEGEASLFARFGGSQFGWYAKGPANYKALVKREVRRMLREPGTLLLDTLGGGYEKLMEWSETAGRMAEFRRMAAETRTAHPTWSEREVLLEAAYQASDILDYAVTGRIVRQIRPFVPFLNASIQGKARLARAIAENPKQVGIRIGVQSVILGAVLYALIASRKDWLKQWRQFNAYRKDAFDLIPGGELLEWIALPRNYEAGLGVAGVVRALDAINGNPQAFEGFGQSLATALAPTNELPLGPALGTAVELWANRDRFSGKTIIPEYEREQDVMVRRGARYASAVGKAVAKAMPLAVRVDPRQIDQVTKGLFGNVGRMAVQFSGRKTTRTQALGAVTGVVAPSPGPGANDVVWVERYAKRWGISSGRQIPLDEAVAMGIPEDLMTLRGRDEDMVNPFQDLAEAKDRWYEANTTSARREASNALIRLGTVLRRAVPAYRQRILEIRAEESPTR